VADRIEVEGTRSESPDDQALHAAGEKLFVESVDVGREFCKFMVGIAAGAIPAYLALVGLAVGREYRPDFGEGILLLASPALFLIASGVFAFAYFPVPCRFSLDLPEDVEKVRAAIIRRRYRSAAAGFAAFAVATLVGIAAATYALSLKSPTKAPVSPPQTEAAIQRALTSEDRKVLITIREQLRASPKPRDHTASRLITNLLKGAPGAVTALANLALDSSGGLEKALGAVLDGVLKAGISADFATTINVAKQENIAHQENVAHQQNVAHQSVGSQQNVAHQQNIAHQQNSSGGVSVNLQGTAEDRDDATPPGHHGCHKRGRKPPPHNVTVMPDTR
jgi:hypothetical protein